MTFNETQMQNRKLGLAQLVSKNTGFEIRFFSWASTGVKADTETDSINCAHL